MTELTYRAVEFDDGPSRVACLELECGGLRFGPSAPALLALGYVLDRQTPATLRVLRDQVTGGGSVDYSSARGTVNSRSGVVTITTRSVDERLAVGRCATLLDAWASVLERASRPVLASAWATHPSPVIARSRVDVLDVSFERVELAVYLLSDGTITDDAREALADYRRCPPDGGAARAALLGELLARDAAPGAPTPARLAHLRDAASSGLIPDAIAGRLLAGGRIDDAQWRVLRAIDGLGPASPATIPRWRVSMTCGGRWVSGPTYRVLDDGLDPRRWLANTLANLAAAGWDLEGSGLLDHQLARGEACHLRLTRPMVRPQLPWE